MNSQAFSPYGQTFVVTADTTAPTGVQVIIEDRFSSEAVSEYRIVNPGTLPVHLGWGPTAALATARAVASVDGTPSSSLYIMPSSVEILRLPKNAFISGLATAPNAIFITIGEGI